MKWKRFGFCFYLSLEVQIRSTVEKIYWSNVLGTKFSITKLKHVPNARKITCKIIKKIYLKPEWNSFIFAQLLGAPQNKSITNFSCSNGVKSRCPPGTILIGLKCQKCPEGTFANLKEQKCDHCIKGRVRKYTKRG